MLMLMMLYVNSVDANVVVNGSFDYVVVDVCADVDVVNADDVVDVVVKVVRVI